jgi:8-oxo-dGTP pyrophosphatase MutT (NUDIX family)
LPVTDRSPVRRAIRFAAYRSFYRLPLWWRRRLVRLGAPSFYLGALVLVRDADAAAPGRLLLLRQRPGPGWSLPGGLLQRGERPIDAAARELAEETGIKLSTAELRAAVPNAVVHIRGRWIDTVFEAEVSAPDAFTLDEAEVHEAAWHPIDALPPLTPSTALLLGHYALGPQAGNPRDD